MAVARSKTALAGAVPHTAAPEPAPVRQPVRETPPPAAAETVERVVARQAVPLIPGRVVALNRAGQPIQRAAAQTGVNRFYIPPHLPPPDWSWEWKRDSVYGETDPAYLSEMYQVGWEHVMYESYPGVFSPEYDAQGKRITGPVSRGAQFLMERPKILTDEAIMERKRVADEKIGRASRQYSTVDASGSHGSEPAGGFIRRQAGTSGLPTADNPIPVRQFDGRQPID